MCEVATNSASAELVLALKRYLLFGLINHVLRQQLQLHVATVAAILLHCNFGWFICVNTCRGGGGGSLSNEIKIPIKPATHRLIDGLKNKSATCHFFVANFHLHFRSTFRTNIDHTWTIEISQNSAAEIVCIFLCPFRRLEHYLNMNKRLVRWRECADFGEIRRAVSLRGLCKCKNK